MANRRCRRSEFGKAGEHTGLLIYFVGPSFRTNLRSCMYLALWIQKTYLSIWTEGYTTDEF